MWNETLSDYVRAIDIAEVDLEDRARSVSSAPYELFGELWAREWGHAEKKEWVERAVREVVVSKGREPLSSRVEVELR